MKSIIVVVLFFSAMEEMVAAGSCTADSDCSHDECCVAKDFLDMSASTCVKHLVEGERCTSAEDAMKSFSGNYMFRCPCKDELTCTPGSYIDLFLFGRIAINARCTHSNGTVTSSSNE